MTLRPALAENTQRTLVIAALLIHTRKMPLQANHNRTVLIHR